MTSNLDRRITKLESDLGVGTSPEFLIYGAADQDEDEAPSEVGIAPGTGGLVTFVRSHIGRGSVLVAPRQKGGAWRLEREWQQTL